MERKTITAQRSNLLNAANVSSTTHIFLSISHRWGFMTATLAASLWAAQNLYEIASLLLKQLNVPDAL
jgi:hypothetical protein